MNWEAIGAVGEIVGALAVFVTLIYLSIQIRQNTKSVRSAALDSSVNTMAAIRGKILEDKEITDIYLRGQSDPLGLDESDQTRFRMLLTNISWACLNLYDQTENAGVSKSAWNNMRPNIKRVYNSVGGIWFWEQYKNEFEDSFVTEMDEIIRD